MKTIKLNVNDYYDTEEKCYLIFLDAWEYDNAEFDVFIELKENNKIKCYLVDCLYLHESGCYRCKYKQYDE